MAVFPDRIVLKNSTDDQATIETAIAVGGPDEITPGEVVIGRNGGLVTIYTLDENNNVVNFSPTSASGRAIVSDDPPTVGISGLPLVDGDLWFESDTDSYYVYYLAAWVQVSGGGGGATSINDLTDVDTSTTPPTNDQVLVWNGANWVPGDQTGGSGGLAYWGGGDFTTGVSDGQPADGGTFT